MDTHDDSCLLSISIANEKDEKEAGEATGLQPAVNQIRFLLAGRPADGHVVSEKILYDGLCSYSDTDAIFRLTFVIRMRRNPKDS